MEQDEREDARGEEVLRDIGGRRVEERQLERFGRGETRGSVEGLVLRSCFKQVSWLYTSKLDVYRFAEVIMTLSSDRLVEMAARRARRARGRLEKFVAIEAASAITWRSSVSHKDDCVKYEESY